MSNKNPVNEQKDDNHLDDTKEDTEEEFYQICTVHDIFNSYVANAIMIDIRSSNEYSKSQIYESINIDPLTVDKPNKNINQSRSGKNVVIYGPKDIIKCYMNIVQFIMMQLTPKSVKIFDNGYDIFKQHYSFICASKGCDSHMYPSVIIPNKLYLGRQKTRFIQKALSDLKITHIIDVTPTEFVWNNNQIKVLKIALQDSEDTNINKYFNEAIEFMDNVYKNNEKNIVFVHCQLGISRSTTIVLAWLMKSKGYKLVDAYKLCQKCRPQIHPNDGFFDQLVKFETELYGKSTENEIKQSKLRDCIVM